MQILAFIIWWNVVGMSRHSIICVHNQYWLFTIVVLMTLGKSDVTSVYFMANHRSRRNKETYNIMPLLIAKFNHQMFGKAFAWEFFFVSRDKYHDSLRCHSPRLPLLSLRWTHTIHAPEHLFSSHPKVLIHLLNIYLRDQELDKSLSENTTNSNINLMFNQYAVGRTVTYQKMATSVLSSWWRR